MTNELWLRYGKCKGDSYKRRIYRRVPHYFFTCTMLNCTYFSITSEIVYGNALFIEEYNMMFYINNAVIKFPIYSTLHMRILSDKY